MAISLQKPLGTDIYNISVFNANSDTIETAVNALLSDIVNINETLPKKYDFVQVLDSSVNIDKTDLKNGIYYISVFPEGTIPDNIPSTNNILIVNSENNKSSQYWFSSDGKIFYREVNESNLNSTWTTLIAQVADNLTTEDSYKSLSAKQGYILNNTKLSINIHNESNPDTNSLNFDNADFGIHICDKTTVSGTIPNQLSIDSSDASNNHFILQSFGIIGETTTMQIASDRTTATQCLRLGYLDNTGNWSWTSWNIIGSSGGGGGGGTNIQLEVVDL